MSINENGLLPRGWARAEIRELVALVNGYAFKPSDWTESGLPIIRIQNLNSSEKPFNRFQGVIPEKFRVKQGDLLFAWSGTPGTSFGAHIWRGGAAWLNQHIFRVEFDGANLDKKYLQLAINRNLDQYIAAAHGGAGLAHITKGVFERSELLMPPLAEQRRIVAAIEEQFSRLDAAVASLERARANLKRYRAAVLQAAISGQLFGVAEIGPGDAAEAPPIFPNLLNGWNLSNLGQIKEHSLYGPRFSSDDYSSTGQHVLRTSDISPSGKVNIETTPKLNLSEEQFKKYRVKRGDILITRTGSLGTLAVFDDDVDAIPGAYLIQYRLRAPIETSWYVFYVLKSPYGQHCLTGGGAGVGRPNLNAPTIESITIPLPPTDEQRAIIDEIERRFSVIDQMERSIENSLKRAERLRQAILKRAFAGELVPQDPSDEPASALLERIRAERAEIGDERKSRRSGERRHGRALGQGNHVGLPLPGMMADTDDIGLGADSSDG